MSKERTEQGDRYDAFAVRNYEHAGDQRAEWVRIGVAFPHQNGDGFRMLLHAVPVARDGVVTVELRRHQAKDDKSAD